MRSPTGKYTLFFGCYFLCVLVVRNCNAEEYSITYSDTTNSIVYQTDITNTQSNMAAIYQSSTIVMLYCEQVAQEASISSRECPDDLYSNFVYHLFSYSEHHLKSVSN